MTLSKISPRCSSPLYQSWNNYQHVVGWSHFHRFTAQFHRTVGGSISGPAPSAPPRVACLVWTTHHNTSTQTVLAHLRPFPLPGWCVTCAAALCFPELFVADGLINRATLKPNIITRTCSPSSCVPLTERDLLQSR